MKITSRSRRSALLSIVLAGSACNVPTEAEAPTEVQTAAAAIGGSCPPLNLECNGNANPTERAEISRLITARDAATRVDVSGYIEGDTVSYDYLDHQIPSWFKITVQRTGPKQGRVLRYIYDWSVAPNGAWRLYYDKSIHPTVSGQNWQWADYSVAARVLGRANDQAFRNQVDGGAMKALSSPIGKKGFLLLAAPSDSGIREAASFCQATCTQAANEISFWFGVAGTIGCGLVVGPAGVACGLVGGGLAYKFIDPTPCFEHCLDCYVAMTKTCKESGSKPVACVDTPWTCKGGGPSTSRSMSL